MYYSTAKEMERLDKLAVKNGLEIRQMMELAGWHMVGVYQELKIKTHKQTAIVCGKGNKGGDGLSAARHLVNHGYKVRVILLSPQISPDSRHHLKLLKKMMVSIISFPRNHIKAKHTIINANVLIDALIGYQLNGAPRGAFAEVIKLMNKSNAKRIAYDLPTGLDPTTGKCFKPCVKTDATLTLALPKRGLKTKEGKKVSGKIFLGDIGIPDFLYDKIKTRSRPNFPPTGILRV